MITGMLAGGLAAVLGITITGIIQRDWRVVFDKDIWGFSALIGGTIGGVVAPVTSWLFLRHVPLGKLVLQTTLATALFGGVGLALKINPFLAAPLGYIAAAARLAIATPRTKARERLSSGDDANLLDP